MSTNRKTTIFMLIKTPLLSVFDTTNYGRDVSVKAREI